MGYARSIWKGHRPSRFRRRKACTIVSAATRGGDVISFIMEKENLSFTYAVVFIAKRYGIEVEYVEEERSEEETVEARHKESLLIVLEHI